MSPLQVNRRGIHTSEFALTVAVAVGATAAAFVDALPPRWAAIAATVSTGAYAIARGLTKYNTTPEA